MSDAGEPSDLVEQLLSHSCGCGGPCGQQTPAYIREAAAALSKAEQRVAELEQEVERIKDTNQRHYDEGYAHGLAFAKLERRAKGKRLAKFVMTGEAS